MEFVSDDRRSWIGNFAENWEVGQRSIHSELGSGAIIVVASGNGYIVDANEKLVREMTGDIQHIWFNAKANAMVVSNGLWFEAFDAKRTIWRSRRLSWDGICHATLFDDAITGEAFDPTSTVWVPFRVELSSGEVEEGSYTGPPM